MRIFSYGAIVLITLSANTAPCDAAEGCIRKMLRHFIPGAALKLPLLEKRDAKLLHSKLTNNPALDYPNYSYLKAIAEEILIAADKDIDLVLAKWLENGKKVIAAPDPNEVKVEKLAKFTRNTLNRSYEPRRHFISSFRYENLNKKSDMDQMLFMWRLPTINRTKLGDYLASKTGICRHQAAALALALRKAGFRADVIAGEVDLRQPNQPPDPGLHAWVEVEIPQKGRFIVDPAMGIFKPFSVNPRQKLSSAQPFSDEPDTIVTYKRTLGSVWHPLTIEKVTDFETPSRNSDLW